MSEELLVFLATELGVDRSRLEPTTRLQHDLGVDGGDGEELLLAFSRMFSVDVTGIDLARYFGPEAGPNPLSLIRWLLPTSRVQFTPIRIQDLQMSIDAGRWLAPGHAV